MSELPHWHDDRNALWAQTLDGDPSLVVQILLNHFPHRVPVRDDHDPVVVEAWAEREFEIGAIGEDPVNRGQFYWTDGSWSWVRTQGVLTYVFTDPREATAFKLRWG